MKKLRVIMRVVGVLLVGVMMYSCSEPAVDEISLNYETTEWGSSLNRVVSVLENKPLSIESYRYLGDITNDSERESLLDDIFDNNEYMLVYIGEDCVDYEIMTYGESIKKLNTKNKDLYLPRRNLVTSQIANHNIGVVELNWDYKGNKFKTKMIVSTDGEKGFLYDNILSYLPAENQPEKDPNAGVPTPTRSNWSNNPMGFQIADHGPLLVATDAFAWEYDIFVETEFNDNKILKNKVLLATYDSSGGWDCEARVVTVYGEIGKSSYHEFMWGYAYGKDMNVSITASGFGLNISTPPGATSASATMSHNSASLY